MTGPHTHTPTQKGPEPQNEGCASGHKRERDENFTQIPNNDELIEVKARPRRYASGDEGEKRVQYMLELKLGFRGQVLRGLDLLPKGEDPAPDLWLQGHCAKYAVEVKSIYPYRKDGRSVAVGQAPMSRIQWESMTSWAQANGCWRLLIVEARIRSSEYGHLYFIVRGDEVDRYMEGLNSDAKMIHFGFYDLACLSSLTVRPGRPIVGAWRP